MFNCHNFITAVRAWTFTVTIMPMLIGNCLAYKQLGSFNVWVFFATFVTLVSGTAAANLVNTYYDFKHQVDGPGSDDQTLIGGLVTVKDVRLMIAFCYGLSAVSFFTLVHLSPGHSWNLIFMFSIMASISFLYTGGITLKYIGLGDITVFGIFWTCPGLFAFLSQGGGLSWGPLVHTLALALNTTAILHSNNIRDVISDTKAGIITLAVLIGDTGSAMVFAVLLFSPYIILVVLIIGYSWWFLLPLLTLASSLKCWRKFQEGDMRKLPQYIASKINLPFGLLYVVACALTAPSRLVGL